MTGTVVMIVQKIPSSKTPYGSKKNCHQENVTSKKMSTKSSAYYEGYSSYDCPNIFLPIKPLKEVEKNAHLQNLTTKKISTGSTVYYDGYGSYDCPKNFLPIKPLREVKKLKNK